MTDDEAVREFGWVARGALAIITEGIAHNNPRTHAYVARKRAVLAHIEARR